MDTLDDFYTTSTDDRLDAQRDIIRESLNEIANDISMAMRDEGLHFPVYITVRNSGDSLATIATPLDPSDHDWSRAATIVCDVIEKEDWQRQFDGAGIALRGCERCADECGGGDCRFSRRGAAVRSIGSVAYDVSWRIVVAHPDLSPPIGGDGTAHCSCRSPDDLRVMAADAGAGIAANIISPRLLWPSSRPLVLET